MKPSNAGNADLARFLTSMKDLLSPVRSLLAEQLLSCAAAGELFGRLQIAEGKLLRPALVFLCGQAAGRLNAKHTAWAAVVEMVHLASLLHDDVIDHADQRRGAPSANALWGNTLAILLGDFVLCQAFQLALAQQMPRAAQLLGQTAQRLCAGEIEQNRRKGDWTMTESEYLSLIEQKTAALFEACCRLGAMASEASTQAEDALAEYGKRLGLAFQIGDDILDVAGDAAAEGKPLGSDLVDRKPTLPILRWLNDVSPAARQERLEKIERGYDVRRDIQTCGALAGCAEVANRCVQQAIDALWPLPDGQAKSRLADFARALAARTAV